MKRIKKLLIISGTGRNTGKTMLAEMLIRKFSATGTVGVKITPHPHPENAGLFLLVKNDDFLIYEETDKNNGKDTSRMLAAGAKHSYLVIAGDNSIENAFISFMSLIHNSLPIVCESPLLARFMQPDLLIVMEGEAENRKDIGELAIRANMTLTISELNTSVTNKIRIENGQWTL